MQLKQMLVAAVCGLFLLKLKWPESKNFYIPAADDSKRTDSSA